MPGFRLLLQFFWLPPASDLESGKIMRPVDGSSFPPGEISVIAASWKDVSPFKP